MRIGPKRHRVALQRAGTAQTATGDIVKTWTTRGHVWASIEALRGEEQVQGMQLTATVTHTIRMRRTGAAVGLTPADRVSYKGRTFILATAINVEERDREIECLATEEVA